MLQFEWRVFLPCEQRVFLGLGYASSFSCMSPSGDLAAPAWTFQGLCITAASVDAEVFEGGF